MVGTLLLVVAVFGVAGAGFVQQSAFERSVDEGVSSVLDGEEYRSLGVQSVSIEYTAPTLSDRTVVTVALARTSDDSYPGLAEAVAEAIEERSDRDVVVRVRFVDYRSSETAPG